MASKEIASSCFVSVNREITGRKIHYLCHINFLIFINRDHYPINYIADICFVGRWHSPLDLETEALDVSEAPCLVSAAVGCNCESVALR